MDLKDEDPTYFELALKWMYTNKDYKVPVDMTGAEQLLYHVNVHRVADKFLMPGLQDRAQPPSRVRPSSYWATQTVYTSAKVHSQETSSFGQ